MKSYLSPESYLCGKGLFLLDTAMSSQGMQDHFGEEPANWLADWLAIRIVNLVSNFIKPGTSLRLPVMTSPEWSDAHEGAMSN